MTTSATPYQVLARKYRPQSFADVLGQEAVVTTLKNAIKNNRLAHAYLFCGARGTGKTTLARLLAKRLNCQSPTPEGEPCNQCSSCKEVAHGNSLNVLEIDGASNRGIDDIRQINETVSYAASSGGYKIYIIDEVHMLTKEAFNALLKTLEEPPPQVKFLFATTEPQKLPLTILSRCQRFNLQRIPTQTIIKKLRRIATEMSIEVSDEVLYLIANLSEGCLRDAESLFDQVISFHDGAISIESTSAILGVAPMAYLFELDAATKAGNLTKAFEIAKNLLSEGKDLLHFINMLTEHFRNILLLQLAGASAPSLSFPDGVKKQYIEAATIYNQEQCACLLDYLAGAHEQIKNSPSQQVALEMILMHVIRSRYRLPIETLVRRLSDLEQKIRAQPAAPPLNSQEAIKPQAPNSETQAKPAPIAAKAPAEQAVEAKLPVQKKTNLYDTLLQFAAVELEGTLKKQVKEI